MAMPEWLRDVLIGLGAFVGGRAVNGISDQMKEGRELRRGVDRLTTAVENIGSDLKDIRHEIHGQVAGLKVEIHDQVGSLRQELHGYKLQQEARLGCIEERIDATSARMNGLSCGGIPLSVPLSAYPPIPPGRKRLNQEMGCYEPLNAEPPKET